MTEAKRGETGLEKEGGKGKGSGVRRAWKRKAKLAFPVKGEDRRVTAGH